MKNIFLFIICMYTATMLAQQPIDTIYANEQKTVALFFPKPIRQAIVGNQYFIFNYNKDQGQTMGLLQATPGEESNLLTITSDGQVYSYLIKYASALEKLSYFIQESESIGNEERQVLQTKKENKTVPQKEDSVAYYQYYSKYLLQTRYKAMAGRQKKGIKLQLQKIAYMRSKVYLVLEIENNSGIDFEIDYLNIYKTDGYKKSKASFQKIEQKMLYAHYKPAIVKAGQRSRFVYVLPKFVLVNKEKLQLELKEYMGSRAVWLKYR